jgi:hypothetical protein
VDTCVPSLRSYGRTVSAREAITVIATLAVAGKIKGRPINQRYDRVLPRPQILSKATHVALGYAGDNSSTATATTPRKRVTRGVEMKFIETSVTALLTSYLKGTSTLQRKYGESRCDGMRFITNEHRDNSYHCPSCSPIWGRRWLLVLKTEVSPPLKQKT